MQRGPNENDIYGQSLLYSILYFNCGENSYLDTRHYYVIGMCTYRIIHSSVTLHRKGFPQI